MATEPWPFEDAPNVAVFTLNRIVKDGQPILQVVHEEEDGGWQFLDGQAMSMTDALLVSLASMLKRDPTLAQLADLPVGWQATRGSTSEAWTREKVQDSL